MLSSDNEGASSVGSAVVGKVKGPKGGPKPPIHGVPPERRLFDAEEGRLLHEVRCFSLYHFTPVPDPAAAAELLRSSLAASQCPLEHFAGTVYVASEGLNAQFSVASPRLAAFEAALRDAAAHALGPAAGAALDLNFGARLEVGSRAPFKRFRVVSRPQILTDGLPPPADSTRGAVGLQDWDWCNGVGDELEAAQWHRELASAGTESAFPVLLDCRNGYESDAGHFKGATALNTATFSESWAALDATVAALPSKDAPVYAYCTGGIRCVKVGAYLVQKHGLTNVRRLKHGIVGYERWASEAAAGAGASAGGDRELDGGPSSGAEAAPATTGSLPPGSAPIWEGDNFIFDQRRFS